MNNGENWTENVKLSTVGNFKSICLKASEMLRIKFDVETVDEVSDMVKAEIKHLRVLAEQWNPKKTKGTPKKVSIKKLLKIKVVGKTKKSNTTNTKLWYQTKIVDYFQGQKRALSVTDSVSKKSKMEKNQPVQESQEAPLDQGFLQENIVGCSQQTAQPAQQQMELVPVQDTQNQIEPVFSPDPESEGEGETLESEDETEMTETQLTHSDDSWVDSRSFNNPNWREMLVKFFESRKGRDMLNMVCFKLKYFTY